MECLWPLREEGLLHRELISERGSEWEGEGGSFEIKICIPEEDESIEKN